MNLDNADTAYEWQFNASASFEPRPPGGPIPPPLSDEEKQISKDLKDMFPAYPHSLCLKACEPANDKGAGSRHTPRQAKKGTLLKVDTEGNGTLKDYVASFVVESAQKALDDGQDLSGFTYFGIEDETVTEIDFWAYSDIRMKKPPAFDSLTFGTPEARSLSENRWHDRFGVDVGRS
jgi:hypothetical protein